ncbi:hypothetical protein Tco_1171705 [Tanacetum coccineum]
MSGMDNDLFTFEVEVANIPCDLNKDDDLEQRVSPEADDNMGYDPFDVAFIEWLGSKKFNYKTMDHYTKNALWIYWIRGDDEAELTNEEFFDNEDEVAKVFRIDTNIFNFETPILMKNIRMIGSMNRTEMYHGLMRNHELILEFGLNPHQLSIIVSLSTIKLDVQNGQHVVRGMMDSVMEETYLELPLLETSSIIRIMNDHEADEREELCEIHKLPVCTKRRFEMIKYSFEQDDEYVAVKEDEYDDLERTSDDACRAYQEIFRMMDDKCLITHIFYL